MLKKVSIVAIVIAFSMINSSAHNRPGPVDSVEWNKGCIITHGTGQVTLNESGTPVQDDDSTVISLNRGRVEGYRKAREKAILSMVQIVKELRVDADTRMIDLLEQNDIVQSRIMALINGRVKFRQYPVDFRTSGCQARLKIGDILAAVPYQYPSDEFPERIDNPISTNYTSLIIDTRGLNIEPMILPSVFSEDGLEVYGRFLVDIRHATKYGIVAYVYNENEAMIKRIAGDHPFYTAAIKEMKGCPVLSDRDVRKIISSRNTIEYLKQCKVIFIIDKQKK